MAEREGSWVKAGVVIAAVSVVASLMVSLIVTHLSIRSAAEQRRVDALSDYQASVTRHRYALTSLGFSINAHRGDTGTIEGDAQVALVTEAAHNAADTAVEMMAAFDVASWHLSDEPEVQRCSQQFMDESAGLVSLTGLSEVSGGWVHLAVRSAEQADQAPGVLLGRRASKADELYEAVGRARDEGVDTPNLC